MSGESEQKWKRLEEEQKKFIDANKGKENVVNYYLPAQTYENVEAAKNQLDLLKLGIIAADTAMWTAAQIAEAASLGQFEGIYQFEPMIASKFGWSTICDRASLLPVEKSLIIPAEYFYNSLYRPLIPDQNSLLQMLFKHQIDIEAYTLYSRMNGYSDFWSDRAYNAAKVMPNLQQLQTALWRGKINDIGYQELKTYIGLDENWHFIWDATLWNVPPYQEIVNERVKEVITQDDFRAFLRLQGYQPEWADRIWTAHFIPPGLNDILVAWRRGVIDEAEVSRLMKIIDLDVDRFKDVFETRKFNDPSISLARFMFEIGAIDKDRVRDIVWRNGFAGKDQDALVDFVTKFQERRWRTRYLVGLSSAMLYGAATEEEIKAEVSAAGYQPGVAEWLIKYSLLRVKIRDAQLSGGKPRLLSVGDLKKLYKTGKFPARDLETELMKRGYDAQDVTWTMSLLNVEMSKEDAGGAVSGLTLIQLVDAWRYKVIDEVKLRNILVLRGLSDEEVSIIEKTYEAKWGVSPQP